MADCTIFADVFVGKLIAHRPVFTSGAGILPLAVIQIHSELLEKKDIILIFIKGRKRENGLESGL